jgi:hypothetical protein
MRRAQEQLGAWEPSQHLLEDGGKQRKPVSRRPVAGLSEHTLSSSQHSCKQHNMGDSLNFP